VKYCRPHPWVRSGPGPANDGKPKFDLTRFDPEYFDRLRSRVIAARDAAFTYSTQWQYDMIGFVKGYEKGNRNSTPSG
jgi:hypothetical protein